MYDWQAWRLISICRMMDEHRTYSAVIVPDEDGESAGALADEGGK